MTITNIRKNRVFKATNIFLIYALLLDITVPFAQTMDKILTDHRVAYTPEPVILPLSSKPSEEVLTEKSVDFPEDEITGKMTRSASIGEKMTAIQQTVALAAPGAGGSGFSINSTDQMVDPFTGDFTYTIPLMDVEGYPINLSYNSNVTMNTEASWVGLGWNLNVGSIEREMRGIPDEFDGTQSVDRVVNQLDQQTVGFKKGKYLAMNFGGPVNDYISINVGNHQSKLKGYYNDTYLGAGRTLDKSRGGNIGVTFTLYYVGLSVGGSWGKKYSYDSKRGINLGTGGGLNGGLTVFGMGPHISTYSHKNYSSREGMTDKTITRGWGIDFAGVAGFSNSHTSTIPYGSQTMVPRVEMNAQTIGLVFTKDRFATLSPFTVGKLTQIYNYSRHQIKDVNNVRQPAIGFLHSSKKMTASGSTLPIMDFNRSNVTQYSTEMTNLPFSMQTFDIFYANALGMQGTFRANRADAGTYEDPLTEDKTTDVNVLDKKGIDQDPAALGIQATYSKEQGIGLTKSSTFSTTLEKDDFTNLMEFTTEVNPVTGFDQAVYFKGVGETTPVDASLYNNLGGLSASRGYVWAVNDNITLSTNTSSNSGIGYTFPSDGKVYLNKPTVAKLFRPRTVGELMASQVQYDTYYTDCSSGPNPSENQISRNLNTASNIISKIEITNEDGVFYGYGIPSMSNSSSQVTFNIGSMTGAPSVSVDAQGLVSFTATDNSVLNSKGLSHYYDRTTVPAYAQSFLLTDMHSPDYIDRTGNGPSLDDIGTYYKFNYRKILQDHHWRFPIAPQKAFYMEGTWGSELDDVATYSAGSKQVWVTHSVESKNYIAEFILSSNPREDGYGIDENGNKISGEKTYALKRIELYNRAERQEKGTSAKPLQIVEFTYTYDLCQNYPSNTNTQDPSQRGKLTLQTVRTYSGTSYEMQHSFYEFDYGTGSINNPDFNYGSIDAWGQLKPGNSTYNARFPYVEQSETTANNNAQAWKLKQINTPNGGIIKITYESDRYGYVQNKRAMKHVKMEGITNIFDLFSMLYENELSPSKIRQEMNTSAYTISPYAVASCYVTTVYQLLFGRFRIYNIPNNVVVFKLDTPIPVGTSNASQKVKEDYFTGHDGTVMKELYLKAHIRVTDSDPSRTELVPLFAAISPDLSNALNNIYPLDEAPAIGVLPPASGSNNYTYGYVVLQPAKVRNPADEKLSKGEDLLNDDILEDEAFNPIQKAAFDFFQRSLQDIVFQNTAFQGGESSVDLLSGNRVDISKAMRELGFATTLVSGYNYLCTYVPSNIKFGGNARVKSIEYSDNWQAITNNPNESTTTYKWNYLYDFNGFTSGVASYESRVSADESPFYGWDTYYNIRVQFPDKFNYTPKPIMEMLYPSGSVGYSKVAVQFDDMSEKGYMISEFHTAKEHPTKESITGMHRETVDEIWKNQGQTIRIYGMTQGFSLETNDFHGKIEAISVGKGAIGVENNPSNILSKTTYEYFSRGEKQKVANETGAITETELGMEYDIHADARMIGNYAISVYSGNKKSWLIPFMAPNGFHNNSSSSSSYAAFYTHVIVKHANRSAIVKRVITEYMGSQNQAENMVFDKYSGGVILKSLTDEFQDKIYSLNYPAHWYYSEFRNISATLNTSGPITLGSNTTITNPLLLSVFSPGDVLKFPFANKKYKWVTKAYPWPLTPKYFLIDSSGSEAVIPSGTYNVIVSSSGRSNQLSAVMQHVETKTNPLGATQINFPTTNILSGGAVTFRDKLNALCGTNTGPDIVNNNKVGVGVANPYLYGLRGDLVADNELSWQSARIQATNDGVRKDGAYTSFVPYYAMNSGKWYQLTHPSHPNYPTYLGGLALWRKSGETTLINQYGVPVEGKDALKINSAQLYGYNRKLDLLPVAIASNAHKQDIAFDGFEDYSYYPTVAMTNFETHFAFEGPGNTPIVTTADYRHSGKYSLKLTGTASATATRAINEFQNAKTTHADIDNNTGQVQNCDCINGFGPTPGDYIFGAWIKQSNAGDGSIIVTAFNGVTPVSTVTPIITGTAIDGWQRIESTINIPNNATNIVVTLKNNSDSRTVYFDDFRMHPVLAEMQTVVYDPVTLLKIASHDAYNFTTFYNYDENNQLVRVRVETSEGIKTLSESEISIYKP